MFTPTGWTILINLIGCCLAASNDTITAKVLILGAGMSGISAAQRLQEQGITDFLVLEGTDRVGGRVREAPLGDYDVELGALWVHGGKTNPLYELTLMYNVSSVEADYEDYIVRTNKGDDTTDVLDEAYEVFDHALEFVENRTEDMITNDKPDATMQGVLKQGGWFPKTPEEQLVEFFDIDFEFAVPSGEVSNKYPGMATYEVFDDTDYITTSPTGGFSQIINGIADEIFSENDSTKRLYLDTVVTEIHQNGSHVIVMTVDGAVFVAERVIVTFSLGVLQNHLVKFVPDLPEWKWDSIFGFQFTVYLHFYMQFPIAFWDDNEYILYASEYRGHYPMWQNFNKFWPGSNILQCSVVQYEAARLDAMSDEEIKAEAMEVLRGMYGASIPDATAIVVPRFTSDPMFMGTFSNWPTGYRLDSHKALKAATGRVHFAGEHTSIEYNGYLHGALFSGQDAADEVIKCIGNICQDYVPPYDARGCTYAEANNYQETNQEEDGSCKFPGNTNSVGVRSTDGTLTCMLTSAIISIFLM